jgi:hypothetical protein
MGGIRLKWFSLAEPCYLLCVREARELSTVSLGNVWWYDNHYIATCWVIRVHSVHNFNRVILALQMVANGLMKIR